MGILDGLGYLGPALWPITLAHVLGEYTDIHIKHTIGPDRFFHTAEALSCNVCETDEHIRTDIAAQSTSSIPAQFVIVLSLRHAAISRQCC